MKVNIDLQTHTEYSSECGWMSPETLVARSESVGLDGVAITDHNTMEGIAAARQIASDDFLVIPGEEVDTPEGQIIGLFLSEPIVEGQSPASVIEDIHAQGGFAVAPHPFDEFRDGLRTIVDYVDTLDAVEVLNSRCVRQRFNDRAQTFAETNGLPGTGGSDAHFARELGTAYTQVTIDESMVTLDSLQRAIQNGNVTPKGRTGSILAHAGTKSVKLLNRFR